MFTVYKISTLVKYGEIRAATLSGSGRRTSTQLYDTSVLKTLLPGFPHVENQSHAASMECCGNSSKERSPGIGQQPVISCRLVPFPKNSVLKSNSNQSLKHMGKSVLYPSMSVYIDHVLGKWSFRAIILRKHYISWAVGINQNFSERQKKL